MPSLRWRIVSKCVIALTGADARQDRVFFGLAIGRNDHANRLADRFARGVAEHPFGRPVPGRDDAVQILADDGVVGRFDDRGEPSTGDGGLASGR